VGIHLTTPHRILTAATERYNHDSIVLRSFPHFYPLHQRFGPLLPDHATVLRLTTFLPGTLFRPRFDILRLTFLRTTTVCFTLTLNCLYTFAPTTRHTTVSPRTVATRTISADGEPHARTLPLPPVSPAAGPYRRTRRLLLCRT